jgi:hypothetical protein
VDPKSGINNSKKSKKNARAQRDFILCDLVMRKYLKNRVVLVIVVQKSAILIL